MFYRTNPVVFMYSRKREVLVGMFVFLGLIALLFFAIKVSRMQNAPQKSYLIQARFDNIGSLKPGAPIKSAGVVVGQVRNIQFNDKIYQAVLELEMDQQYHFPKDSQFKIVTAGLLGDQYIGVSAGSDTDFLTAGMHVDNTQSALVLEELIGKFLYSKAQEAGKS